MWISAYVIRKKRFDRPGKLNVLLINVHCKDNNNLLEKVQIPILNVKFPQYNTAARARAAVKMASNLVICCM